jgi:hypothetical protein
MDRKAVFEISIFEIFAVFRGKAMSPTVGNRRRSVCRGRPYGEPEWQRRIAKRLGLESAYRSAGRPG